MCFSKRKLSFFIFTGLLVSGIPALAQRPIDADRQLDSLDNVLRTGPTDTARIDALQRLSNYWLYKDSAKAMTYARQSGQAAGRINDYFRIALSHFYVGNVYMEYYNLPLAEQELMTAERLLHNDSSYRGLRYRARIWHNYGAICQRKDDSRQFLDIMLNRTAPLLEKARDSLTLALTYKDIGLVLMNYGQYDKALEYYERTIRQFRDNIGYEELAGCYSYAAQTLLFQDKYEASLPYLDKALSILSRNKDSREWVLYYTVRGMYSYFTKATQKALDNYDKGLVLANRWQQLYPSLNLLMGKYKIYSENKDYVKARKTLYELKDKTAGFPLSANKLSMLKNLATMEEKTGHPQAAYRWLSQYSQLSDSLNEDSTRVKISALEAKFASEKKEKEIVTLQSQTRQQQLGLQHHRLMNYLLLSGILILLLLSLSMYLLYRNKRRLVRQQEEVHRRRLKDLEQEQQLTIFNAILKGQEQERNRLARDLHDGLGGMLAGVKMQLSAFAEKEETNKSDMELYRVISQLDQSVHELRRIARDMMPETLLQFGLEPALKELCASMATASLQVEFQGYGISRNISAPEQAAIYRIIQELLTNAIRHAGPATILVQCSQNENIFFISVEDDGRGFQPAATEGNGIGLSNIRNRVNFLKGKMEIHSQPGEGTTINIEVHVHE